MRCDFCDMENPYPEYTYYCDPFEKTIIGITGDASLGGIQTMGFSPDWLACEECAALIEAGDKEGLAERFFSGNSIPEADATRRELIRNLHKTFWATKKPGREVSWKLPWE